MIEARAFHPANYFEEVLQKFGLQLVAISAYLIVSASEY